METMIFWVLLGALLVSLIVLVATSDDWNAASDFRVSAAMTFVLGALFFALGLFHAYESPGAWGFRLFYAALCIASLVASNWFVLAETGQAS